MTTSPLHTVPHLPVPIDTDQRNPLPSYHTSTALKRDRVPLRTQAVALHPTGVFPVALKTIPTRPIEVQPLSPVPSPRGPRLPQFAPPKDRISTVGKWERIQIASQEPSATVFEDTVEVEDGVSVEDAQLAFEIGHEQVSLEEGHEQGAFEPAHGSNTVLLKERVALPMQRIPLMSVQPLRIATSPVRTHTVAVRRPKKLRRPKKSSSARIW